MRISKEQLERNKKRLSDALGKRIPFNVWSQFECVEYLHDLTDQEVKYIAKMYNELYNDGISFTKPEHLLLKDPDAQKEARKNHNSNKRDAFNVAKKSGRLEKIDNKDYAEFMDDYSDYLEWEQTYHLMGYEAAVKVIFEQAVHSIKEDENIYLTLSRFLCKIKEVKSYNLRDKRTDREVSKAKEKANGST